jgi:hypothetical protein
MRSTQLVGFSGANSSQPVTCFAHLFGPLGMVMTFPTTARDKCSASIAGVATAEPPPEGCGSTVDSLEGASDIRKLAPNL